MSFTNPYPASRLTVDTANSLANGLVGFWPLTDGGSSTTAKDISTGANDGTLGTGVTWSAGNLGTNAEFPSTTAGRIDTALDMAGSSAVTVSAWVRNDGGSVTNSFGKIVSQSHVGSFDTYMDKQANAALSLKINSTTVVANNADIPAIGTWFHVCFVWQQSVTQAVYINGELSNSGTADTSVIGATTHNVFIGGTSAAPRPWDGGIQNVRIYNRALSATEVATLYNRPWESTNFGDLWPYSPPAPSSATLSTDTAATSLNVDLEGWWLATDNTGTTLVDISGNGRDATLNGTNSWVADSVGTVNRFNNSSRTSHAETANTQPDLSSGYTFSTWIKHEEAGTSGSLNYYGAGIVLGNSSGSSDVEIYFNQRIGVTQWPALAHNRSNGGSFIQTGVEYPNYPTDNQTNDNEVWVHYSVTWDGSNARFYRNGTLYNTVAVTQVPLSSSGYKLYINELPVVSTLAGLTCSMQNIRLYSRTLSADEITLLYERPFEGIEYGDAFHYDPPTPANLTPLTSDPINTDQELWLPLTDGTGTTAVDISGNGNDGTLTGTSSNIPEWHVGRLGSSVEGDGTNARRVEISNTALSTVSAMSVSCWIFNDAVNNYEVYFGYGQLNYLFALQRVATQDVLRFFTVGLTGNTDLRTPAGTLKTGVWQNVVCTYDGSTKKIYFDGVEVASASSTGSITQPTNNTAILSAAGSGFDVDGKMTNVRLWSRSLSSQEVWDIYQNAWLGSAYQASAAAVYYNYILRSKRFRRLG